MRPLLRQNLLLNRGSYRGVAVVDRSLYRTKWPDNTAADSCAPMTSGGEQTTMQFVNGMKPWTGAIFHAVLSDLDLNDADAIPPWQKVDCSSTSVRASLEIAFSIALSDWESQLAPRLGVVHIFCFVALAVC